MRDEVNNLIDLPEVWPPVSFQSINYLEMFVSVSAPVAVHPSAQELENQNLVYG